MLDRHLAELYGVETRVLLQAVNRNKDRFPPDFMFQFSKAELELWRSHIVISNPSLRKGLRRKPYAFTEQGVAMLSTVLQSKRAVQVNIAIMRAFVKLRELLITHKDLARKLEALERKYGKHDVKIRALFTAIKSLMAPDKPPSEQQIGFRPPTKR